VLKVSWTHALRTIVKNCYKHHGREDLLPEFHEDNMVTHHTTPHFAPTMVQTINNPDGTVSIIQIDTGDGTTPQVVTLADGTQAQVVHTVGDVVGSREIIVFNICVVMIS
jgi:nuclear respiratory factor 1